MSVIIAIFKNVYYKGNILIDRFFVCFVLQLVIQLSYKDD